jgi:hypothetical protein
MKGKEGDVHVGGAGEAEGKGGGMMSISAWHLILLKTQKLHLYQVEYDRINSVAPRIIGY